MDYRTTRWALIVLITWVLAGCASPVSGHRLVDHIQPIKKINVVVQYGAVASGSMDYDPAMRGLLTQLSNRVPLMLTINGIETERTDSRYGLVFGPRVARSYTRRDGPGFTELNVIAAVLDKASGAKKIWEGEMIYVVGPSSSLSDSAIDTYAREILEQLAKDKVLNLQADAIVMPSDQLR